MSFSKKVALPSGCGPMCSSTRHSVGCVTLSKVRMGMCTFPQAIVTDAAQRQADLTIRYSGSWRFLIENLRGTAVRISPVVIECVFPSSAEEGWMRASRKMGEATSLRADGVVLV